MQKITILFLSMIFPLQAALFLPLQHDPNNKVKFSSFVLSPDTVTTEEEADLCSDFMFKEHKNPRVLVVDRRDVDINPEEFIQSGKVSCILFNSQQRNNVNRAQSKVYIDGNAIYTELTRDFKRIEDVSLDKNKQVLEKYTNTIHKLMNDATYQYLNEKHLKSLLVIIDVAHNDSSSLAMYALMGNAFKQSKITNNTQAYRGSVSLLLPFKNGGYFRKSDDEVTPKVEEIFEDDEDKSIESDNLSSSSSEDDLGESDKKIVESRREEFQSCINGKRKQEKKRKVFFMKYKTIGLGVVLASIVGLLYYSYSITSDVKTISNVFLDFMLHPFTFDIAYHEFIVRSL